MKRIIAFVLLYIGATLAQSYVDGLIDGQVWTAANSPYHVTGDVTVADLTIEPGVRVLFDGPYSFEVSGLLTAAGSSSDSIRFSADPGNSSGWQGIFFNNADANCRLSYASVRDVNAEAALKINGGSIVLSDLHIGRNSADGIVLTAGAVEVTHSRLDYNNYGLRVQGGGTATLYTTVIRNNQNNGLKSDNGDAYVYNSAIDHNAQQGIMISRAGDQLELKNSVVAFNSGEGVVSIEGLVTISNSIIYFNDAVNQIFRTLGQLTVDYSDVQDMALGGTNIDQDPLFSDDSSFALSVQPRSPCIDAGDPASADEDSYFPPSSGGRRNDMGIYGGPLARKWYSPLYIDPLQLDFGDVNIARSKRLPFLVKNYADSKITVNNVTVQGQDAAKYQVDSSSAAIPAQIEMADSLQVWMRFTPQQARNKAYQAQAVVQSDIDQMAVDLAGRGVVPDILVVPSSLEFGDTLVGRVKESSFRIFNSGSDTLKIDSIIVQQAAFSTQNITTAIPPGIDSMITVPVWFAPDTIRGYSGRVRIYNNVPDRNPLNVDMSGNGSAPVLEISKKDLDFGAVLLQRDSLQAITLTNIGSARLEVSSLDWKFGNRGFTLLEDQLPLVIETGNSSELPVKAHPADLNMLSDTLQISSNDPFKPQTTIPARVEGIAALIRLSRQTLEYGDVLLPADSIQKITFYNDGNRDLQVSRLWLDGPDTLDFRFETPALPLTIVPGDSEQIDVQYQPGRAGTSTANLRIAHNDPTRDTLSLALSGTGRAAHLALSSRMIDFGQVSLRSDSTWNLELSNTGNLPLEIDSLYFKGSNLQNMILPDVDLPLNLLPGQQPYMLPLIFAPQDFGPLAAELILHTNAFDSSKITIPVSGQGVAALIRLSSQTINFGELQLPADSSQRLTVYNEGNLTLDVVPRLAPGADSSAFVFAGGLSPFTVQPADSHGMSVGFSPDRAGNKQVTLELLHNDPTKDTVRVELSGKALAAQLDLNFARLDFGNVSMPGDSALVLQLFNSGNQKLIIDSLFLEGTGRDDIQLPELTFPLQLLPGAPKIELAIHFNPQIFDELDGRLVIKSNDAFAPLRYLPLSGRGVAAHLVLGADSVDFGTVRVGRQRAEEVRLRNAGNIDLIIEKLAYDTSRGFKLRNSPELPFTLMPDSSKSLIFDFIPTDEDTVSIYLEITSTDYITVSRRVRLKARAVKPLLVLNPQYMDFGRVRVGADSTLELTMQNQGSASIQVDSLRIVGNQAGEFELLNPGGAFLLQPGSEPLAQQILFKPATSGLRSARLMIYSDATAEGWNQVQLSGLAYVPGQPLILTTPVDTLNSGSVFVHESRYTILRISNPGNADLVIDSLRLAGTDAADFSVTGLQLPATLAAQSDTAKLNIAFSPRSTGDKSARLIMHSNDPTHSPYTVYLKGSGKLDSTPPSFSFNPANIQLTLNEPAEIALSISDDSTSIYAVRLYYRQTGAAEFKDTSMSQSNGLIWTAAVDSEMINERGLQFYVSAMHGGRQSLYPPEGPEKPVDLQVNIPELTFPQPTVPFEYRKISIPVVSAGKTLRQLFEDDLGSYDDTRYRIFDWDQSQKAFTEIRDLQAALPPGKSLYLITKEAVQLDIENVVSVPARENYKINLQAGWNLIANPFAFPVSWTEIDRSSLSSDSLFYWDGRSWQHSTVLQPFKGYAVKTGAETELEIPARAISTKKMAVNKKLITSAESENWYIRIDSEKEGDHKNRAWCGARTTASDEWDRLDTPLPPTPGNFVQVFMDHEDWQEYPGQYSADFRRSGARGYVYDLTLESNIAGPAHLRFSSVNLPQGWDWMVVSPQTSVQYDKHGLETSLNQQNFRLMVGNAEFLQLELQDYRPLPNNYSVTQNYPNPFNPQTRINYDLPQGSFVSIKVFNILGQKVKTLTLNELKEAGYYTVVWDGTDDNGLGVATGIYILQLRAGQYSKSIKMILQR